ncbi:hypothetical protein NPX13_g1571 [Xylaria arbuscula]|uniref:F-BAR domain-containing protein n=1 Tax=Xylaria arbuscula TaxID=114810 RepID=A0A9W8NKT1_9PEZI|nr:hypothetical protein NPX13_g1571 [Xylaria arbuscula]
MDSEGPTVALSFANNFWGKDDAGVGPLLDRMASAKQTSDELRSFYSAASLCYAGLTQTYGESARASLEDDYARKLMSLSRKPLGSHEMGSLKHSLDTVRGEVESMAKQHANIAAQMKSELEEPLAAFAGGMKERRKIIQNTVEKILKVKIQQTHTVNKTRDRYEQDCLKIKGYLAQGHMVMGQEERKNKAKLEKTQISLASTNAEYEQAVKALEDTTARWNREWKAAADKFQDLEEERLDFSKSSLWTFANLASTVCVSDDASCEKIRLSLETMDVEEDIIHFIKEMGTGQEIPDAPKYINFCRGDVDDHNSDVSEEENYSVAQFPRSINPAFRTSSPQPSTFESHHDPNSRLARDLAHREPESPLQPEPPASKPAPTAHAAPAMPPQNNYPPMVSHPSSRPTGAPRKNSYPHSTHGHPRHSSDMSYQEHNHPSTMAHQNAQPPAMHPQESYGSLERRSLDRRPAPSMQQQYDPNEFAAVPHDPYPMDGMTMLCRTDGANSVSPQKTTSRYDNIKPASTAPNLSSRAEAFAPVQTADGPTRVEATNSAPSTSLVSRWDTMRTSATASNMQPRMDGLNTTPRSSFPVRHERRNSAAVPNEQPRIDALDSAARSNTPARREVLSSATASNVQSRIDGINSVTTSNVSARYEGMNSATSSNISSNLSGGDDNSDYSNPTSLSSQEPPSGKVSPVKPEPTVPEPAPVVTPVEPEKRMTKKKSGFFQNHSPFRRKSTKDVAKDARPSTRNTWGPASQESTTLRRPQVYQPEARTQLYPPEAKTVVKERTASPEPIEADASLALNIGGNVFPVTNTDKRAQSKGKETQQPEEQDPIALALAELRGAADNKQATSRISADRYHGISTPIPDRTRDRTHERTQSQSQEQHTQRPVERSAERPQERPQERPRERTQERPSLFTRPVPAPRASTEASSVCRLLPSRPRP